MMNRCKNIIVKLLVVCLCVLCLCGCGAKSGVDSGANATGDSGANVGADVNAGSKTGAGNSDAIEADGDSNAASEMGDLAVASDVIDVGADGVNASVESGIDRQKQLAKLAAVNEDAIAWITVDGTDIDGPVMQSWEEDDYYSYTNRDMQPDSKGEMYIEMANMANMCDFNTVIHGSGGKDGIFTQLINFENPSFFEENEEFVIYLPDNKLTYEIWAVFERDNTSLIRTYDFTYQYGCKQFIDDVYGDKVMGKQIRGGWGDANENMFMVTLTIDNPSANKQLVVIGALIDDEQGTINRAVFE